MKILFQASLNQRKGGISILMSDKIQVKEKCQKGQWSLFCSEKKKKTMPIEQENITIMRGTLNISTHVHPTL